MVMRSSISAEGSRARSSQAKTQAVATPVEAELAQDTEEAVPVDLALADVEVLVDTRRRALGYPPARRARGRVEDVALAGRRLEVEDAGDVDVRQLVAHVPPHGRDVGPYLLGSGEVEGVRVAVQAVRPGLVDDAHEVDGGGVLLAEVELVVGAGCRKNGMKSSRGENSMYS